MLGNIHELDDNYSTNCLKVRHISMWQQSTLYDNLYKILKHILNFVLCGLQLKLNPEMW